MMNNGPGGPGMMNNGPGGPGMMYGPGRPGMMHGPGGPGMMHGPGGPGMMYGPGGPGMMGPGEENSGGSRACFGMADASPDQETQGENHDMKASSDASSGMAGQGGCKYGCPTYGAMGAHEGGWMDKGGPEGQDPQAVTSRLDALKQNLGITSSQEKEWQAYADAVTELSSSRQAMRHGMRETLPNYLERMEQILKNRERVLVLRRAVLQKYRSLYQSLSPIQQETMLRQGSF
ncbi:MAG: Spy/CpxP family protein refolding chaperone [Magnetococcales bacterium]|nr:Spy/CpxP family protein refolding chaperone [Magnetococcales bacterium]